MEDTNTQELPVDASADADSSGVAEQFTKHEFNRVNQVKEPIEKLADAMESKPELSETESQTELSNTDSAQTKEELPPTKDAFNYEKWDGKVESLPEKLQKIVKDNQAMATAKAQEAARYKQELELLSVKREEAIEQPLVTPEEYEEAQLSPAKFVEVVNKLIARGVEKKAAELMPIVNQVQRTQQVAENEKAINDFAKEHEDFWELHDASPSLFMALIGQNRDLGKTYETLKQFKNSHEEKAKQAAQNRVKEKKNASTFSRTAKHTENVMYIEGTKDDVLRKQIELSLAGKNIRVKLKK